MITPLSIVRLIRRYRHMRRWAIENDDRLIYDQTQAEISWWKRILRDDYDISG